MLLVRLTLAGCLALPLAAQIRTEDSVRKWREDVEVLRREMPRVHANLFQTISRETFTRAVDELEASIPRRADHEIVVEIARIVASIGDGHTFMNFAQPAVGFRMLPVRFYEFKDGVHVRAAAPELAELAGARVLAIDGRPTEEVWRAVAAITPHENESGLRSMNAVHIAIPEILHGLGISSSKDRVTVRVEQNGKQRDVVLEPRPIMDVWRMKMIDARPESVAPRFPRRARAISGSAISKRTGCSTRATTRCTGRRRRTANINHRASSSTRFFDSRIRTPSTSWSSTSGTTAAATTR
jgi:hypothetical protein